MTTHKWQFAPRFRRHAYGWKSATPIQRIKEAISEIKLVARYDAVLAAEGAVLLLEKLSPALEHVDSSSGALGTAVYRAIETLVPIIIKADVSQDVRHLWMERLWQALQDDAMPYIESLGDYWGELCVTDTLASLWADEFFPTIVSACRATPSGSGYFKGAVACMSSLYAANRHDDLLMMLDIPSYKWWHYRRWGVKVLVAKGMKAEAIRYAEASRELNTPGWQIAEDCEAILLSSGLSDEAYTRYALEANQKSTYLATFRAIAKKYPHKIPAEILRDLIASTPGNEGKWFAAAKDAGLLDVAAELIKHSPTDPRTLIRAARDFAELNPEFAHMCGMAALHWIVLGYGYEITSSDVLDAYKTLLSIASLAGIDVTAVKEQIREQISGRQSASDQFVAQLLAPHLIC